MATRFDVGTVTNPVFAGTTISITFTLSPTATTTGWNTQVTFKKQRTDNAPIITYTPSQSSVGIWTIVMAEADTSLFASPGTYVYDFERTDVGFKAVLTYGFIQFDQKVNS